MITITCPNCNTVWESDAVMIFGPCPHCGYVIRSFYEQTKAKEAGDWIWKCQGLKLCFQMSGAEKVLDSLTPGQINLLYSWLEDQIEHKETP